MSVFRKMMVTCPACQAVQEFRCAHSVNADLRDDLRLSILDDEFQRTTCSQCTRPFRIEPEFTFVDVGRSLWVAAFPLPQLAQWDTQEEHAAGLFRMVYTGQAPEAIQAVGRGLKPRVVFGWAALREKLVINQHELDDTTIELCKAAILRSAPAAPVDAQVELRLLGVEGEELVFGWIFAADETIGEIVRVKRGLYDLVAADEQGDWADLRGELGAGMFVDLNRMLVVPEHAT